MSRWLEAAARLAGERPTSAWHCGLPQTNSTAFELDVATWLDGFAPVPCPRTAPGWLGLPRLALCGSWKRRTQSVGRLGVASASATVTGGGSLGGGGGSDGGAAVGAGGWVPSSAVGAGVGDAAGGAGGGVAGGTVGGEVGDAVGGAVGDAVGDALGSALGVAVGGTRAVAGSFGVG